MHNFYYNVKKNVDSGEGENREEEEGVKIQGCLMRQCAKSSDTILLLKLLSFFHTYSMDDQSIIFSC